MYQCKKEKIKASKIVRQDVTPKLYFLTVLIHGQEALYTLVMVPCAIYFPCTYIE